MKLFIGVYISILLLYSVHVDAQQNTQPAATVSYYGGDVRVITLSSGELTIQKLIMARTVNPQANLIIEDACIQTPGQPIQHSPTYIIISNGAATLSDSPPPAPSKTFTGTGELFGQDWNWNYLKYAINFTLQSGTLRIADDNFITPTQFIARKQLFFTPQGAPSTAESPVQLWDTELAPMTQAQYQSDLSTMGCP